MPTATELEQARELALLHLDERLTLRQLMERLDYPKPSFRALRDTLDQLVTEGLAITWKMREQPWRPGYRPDIWTLTHEGRLERAALVP